MFRVQEEFERDYMKNVDKDGYEAKMKDPNLTADEKKKEKALYEAMAMKARRRSLGESSFNLYPGYILYILAFATPPEGWGLENKILKRKNLEERMGEEEKSKKGEKRGEQ